MAEKKPRAAALERKPPFIKSIFRFKKEPAFTYLLWGLFIVYTIAILYGITKHEPWRDEAQKWLVARDTSFLGLFKLLPSEGHPPLWYLLLTPLAKIGLPYISMNVLNALIMIAAVYLLLFKTKIPLLLKVVLPFSYFFLFEYALIARNYGLIVFFAIAIISLYSNRYKKPLLYSLCVIGLFNSHVLVFPLAFTLTLLFIIDAVQNKLLSKKIVISIIMMLIGGLYLIPYIALNKVNKGFADQLSDHQQHILDAITNGLLVSGNQLLALVLLCLFLLFLITRPKALLLLLIAIGGILYILGYRYSGYIWHDGVLFIILVTIYGIAVHDKPLVKLPIAGDMLKYGQWLLAIVAVMQYSSSFSDYKQDIDFTFSGAQAASAFIIDHHLNNDIMVGEQAWAVSAIAPYLGKDVKFYYSECQRYGTYYINDSCFFKQMWTYPTEYAVKVAYEKFTDKLDRVVLILNAPVQPGMSKFLDLLYQTPETPIRQDEAFYIYKFKKGVN